MGRRSSGAERLDTALDRLAALELDGLRAMWLQLQGSRAPETFRTALLRSALAYTLQERALGGLRPTTKSLLRRVAEQADRRDVRAARGSDSGAAAAITVVQDGRPESPSLAPTPSPPRQTASRIKPGTRLLRVWQGRAHEVLVEADGVSYRGQRYRSLSEVARLITGQRWSGPLFFGLKGRAGETATPRPSAPALVGYVGKRAAVQ